MFNLKPGIISSEILRVPGCHIPHHGRFANTDRKKGESDTPSSLRISGGLTKSRSVAMATDERDLENEIAMVHKSDSNTSPARLLPVQMKGHRRHCVHRRTKVDPILSQLNPAHNFKPYFTKIRFNNHYINSRMFMALCVKCINVYIIIIISMVMDLMDFLLYDNVYMTICV